MTAATFYTVTDSDFFPGTVALLNSLRLVGHNEPLVVLDNGLTASKRERLEGVASVVDLPSGSTLVAPPTLKPFPRFIGASGTIVLIDSDMIVTASLASTLALAEQGQICLYPDPEDARWFAEWEELFSLSRQPRRQTYVNSGLVAFSVDRWPCLLEDWWAACLRVPADRMFTVEDQPLRYGDQDALNGILMSEVDAESIVVLPRWGVSIPHKRQPTVIDQDTLACTCDEGRVSILHHYGRPKVWSRTGRQRLRFPEAYVRLFPRVVSGRDVALRLAPSEVPWWLRLGSLHRFALGYHRARILLGPAKRIAIAAVRGTGRRVQRATGRLRAEP